MRGTRDANVDAGRVEFGPHLWVVAFVESNNLTFRKYNQSSWTSSSSNTYLVSDHVLSVTQTSGEGQRGGCSSHDVALEPITAVAVLLLVGLQSLLTDFEPLQCRGVVFASRNLACGNVVDHGAELMRPLGVTRATIPDERQLVTRLDWNEPRSSALVGSGTAWKGRGVSEMVGVGMVDPSNDTRCLARRWVHASVGFSVDEAAY